MIGLFRNDFYLVRSQIILFTVMILLMTFLQTVLMVSFSTEPVSPSGIPSSITNLCTFLIFIVVFFGGEGLKGNLLLADRNKRSKHFLMATPLCVKGCVASKYYEGIIIPIVGFIYLEVFQLTCGALTGNLIDHSLLFVCMIFVSLFFGSLSIPFYVRFGQKGVHIKTAILLSIVFLLFVYGLFGDISMFIGNDPMERFMNVIVYFSDTKTLFSRLSGADDPRILWLVVTPILILVMYYVSYRISCILYRKGAEADEI